MQLEAKDATNNDNHADHKNEKWIHTDSRKKRNRVGRGASRRASIVASFVAAGVMVQSTNSRYTRDPAKTERAPATLDIVHRLR